MILMILHAEGKPARKVRDCFLPQINLLNDATEKLAQAIAQRLRPSGILNSGSRFLYPEGSVRASFILL